MDFLEQPLETFTEATIQQALNEEAELTASIGNVDREIEKTQARLVEIKARFDESSRLTRSIGLTRQERAEKLAAGQDHSEVSEQITSLQAQLQSIQVDQEILEDEQNGLARVLEKLQKNRIGLVASLDSAQQDTKAIRFCVAANEYNNKAEKMGQLVDTVWELYNGLPDKYSQLKSSKLPRPKDVWYSSIFTYIPILRMDWSDKDVKHAFVSRFR
ncbi:MAG: hypothetical protein AAGU21_15460 [Solidesulfovibrio sp.]|uniref:hypothetical protein n=1 Tax=Solidesulfovibrio sp. TaxID=2910990 RepID=UPI003158E91B